MHWSLVLAVAGSWASQEIDGIPFSVHLWCGYAVLVLVATRLIWGLIGTRHARFTSFVKGPAAVWRYARTLLSPNPVAHPGHNPLGALMVLLLLVLLFGQALSGLFANDQILDTGPLFGYVSSALSDRLTTVHKQLFDFLLAAVALHVLAAVLYLVVKHENLILPMLTGRKPAALVPVAERIRASRTWLAALVAAALALGLYCLVQSAPEASLFIF